MNPVNYLQDVIREDRPERASAFLAVGAGVSLIIGFFVLLAAVVFWGQRLSTELITVTSGLVALATFNKVDRNSLGMGGGPMGMATGPNRGMASTTITRQDSVIAPIPVRTPTAGVGSDD